MHIKRSSPRHRHPIRTAILGLAAAMVAQACFSVNNDPKPDETGQPAGGPDIVLSTEVVDFGTQAIGSTGSQALLIDNAGTSELTLSSFELQSEGQVFTLPPTLPLGVMAGNTANITLRFTPNEYGPAEAQLIVHSNDPDTPAAEVLLQGRGTSGDTGG